MPHIRVEHFALSPVIRFPLSVIDYPLLSVLSLWRFPTLTLSPLLTFVIQGYLWSCSRLSSELVRQRLEASCPLLRLTETYHHTLHTVCASLGIRPQNNLVVGFHLSISEMMRLSISLCGFQDCSDAPNSGLIGECGRIRTFNLRSQSPLCLPFPPRTHICRQGLVLPTLSADFPVVISNAYDP